MNDRLQELLDRDEIRRLVSRYSHHADQRRDLDLFLDLFTDDGVLDVGEYGVHVGKDVIRQFMSGFDEEFEHRAFRTLHVTADDWVEFTGPDTAEGRWYMVDFVVEDEGSPLKVLAIYDDDYRREGGEWKFAVRRWQVLWPIPPEPLRARIPGEQRDHVGGPAASAGC